MANNSFSINLDLDKQRVEEGLKQLGQTIDKNITDKKLSIQIDQQKLNEQLKAVESKLKKIENKKIGFEVDSKSVDAQIQNLQNKIANIDSTKIKAGVSSDEATKEIALLQKELNKLTDKKAKLSVDASSAEAEINSLVTQMAEIEDQKAKIVVDVDDSDVRDLQESINNIDDSKKINIDAEADTSQIDDFNTKLDEIPENKVVTVKLEDNFVNTAAKATAIGGLGAEIGDLAEAGVEYASAMKLIRSETGLTGLELEKFNLGTENVMRNGAAESVLEASQLMVEARKILGKSATTSELTDYVTTSQAIAKRYGKEVEEVMSASSSSVKNFGISGKKSLEEIAAGLSSVGKNQDYLGSVQEFSAAYRDAGKSISDMNEDMIAADKTGADSINKVADATNEMKNELANGGIIDKLKAIDGAAARSMQKLAEQQKAGLITQKEFEEKSAAIVNDSNNKISESMKRQLAEAIGGSMGADAGSNFWKKFNAKVDIVDGKELVENLKKDLEPKNIFDKFVIEAKLEFGKITSAIAPAMKSVGSAMQTFGQVAPGLELISKFSFADTVKSTKEFASGIAKGAAALMGTMIPATTAATAAQEGLNVAQSANPMGAIILAVIALGLAMYVLYQKSETFRNTVNEIGSTAKDIFGGIVEAVSPLGDTLKAIGSVLLKYITAPFQFLFGVVKGVFDHFKSGEQSATTMGQKIAGLKPIFEKISEVASGVFKAIGVVVQGFIDGSIKVAVAVITTLIDTFITIGTTVRDTVGPIFTSFYNSTLKPIVGAIGSFIDGVGKVIDSTFGISKAASEESKAELEQFKKNRQEMESIVSNSFGAATWSDEDKVKQKERLQSLHDQMLASAKIIQNEQERAKQIKHADDLLAEGMNNMTVLTKEKAEAEAAALEAKKNAKIAEDKADAATRNQRSRDQEIFAARKIADELKMNLKISEINEKYDLIAARAEKKSGEEILSIKSKFNRERALLEENDRKKKFETSLADAKEDSKSTIDASAKRIEELKRQIDEGDTSALAEFTAESWKKMNYEHESQISDFLDKDKDFIKKSAELAKLVGFGDITSDDATKQLDDFRKQRLDVLKATSLPMKNLIKVQTSEETALKKSLAEVDNEVQLQTKLKGAKTLAEYEKTEKLLNLQKSMQEEIKAAKGNNVVILRAKMNFWKESAKIERDYMDSTATYSTKLFKNLATVFGGIFKNLKIGNNSDSINQAKSDLKTVEDALKSLDAQRLEGSINATEYEIKQQELLAQKQDAMDRAGQSYLNFGSIVQSVNDAIVESMRAMVESTMAENAKLYEQMAENQISIDELRKKGNEATAEESAELLRLTDEQETKKQELYGNTALIMSSVFVESVASQKSALKSLVMAILSAMKAMIPAFIAMIWGIELGTKGFPAGNISAMLLTGLLYGLVGAAEGIVGQLDFAKGGENPYGGFGQGFGQGLHKKQKNVLLRVAETGKSEYVFNPFVTAASDIQELDMINKLRISPKEFYARQLGSTNNNIDVSLLYNELVNIKKTLQSTKMIDQKTVVQNHLKVTAEVKSESLRKY